MEPLRGRAAAARPAWFAAIATSALATSAMAGWPPVLSGSYSWEDGVGTVLGTFGNAVAPANITFPEPVNFGSRALRITEAPHGGTPEVWVAFIENLEHGDVIEASVFGYDDTFGALPSVRIWAHYAVTGNIESHQGSAGGNNNYTAGFGWQEIRHTWTFDSGSGVRNALVIEVRLYSNPPDCPACSTDFYIDDVTVNVICASNPNLSITFPDGTVVTGPGKAGPNCVPVEPCTAPSHNDAYGWEDGEGTIFGTTGNIIDVMNIGTGEGHIHGGTRGLRLVQSNSAGSTPQAWIAYIKHLNDGDTVRAGFHAYTDVGDDIPRLRIWAHYAVSGNHNSVLGQAGGNNTYSTPGQWVELQNEWIFDSNFGQRDALMIQARLYTAQEHDVPNSEFFVDDLWVEVCSNNPGVAISFPDSVDVPEPIDPCGPDLGMPDLSGSFGWEDGESTILGSFGNLANPTNIMAPDPVNTGTHALRVTEQPHQDTPQTYVAYIQNLSDGDVIVGRFHGFDTTSSGLPSMRIWAHYAHSGDVLSIAGSAGGNNQFTSGIGWEEICHTWVFDVGNPPRDALVIKVRLYSDPPTCEECSTDYYIDDLSVDVYSDNPDVTITFPGGVVIGHSTTKCLADFINDGSVGVLDLLTLLAAWGTADPQIDLNGDGNVDVQDLLVLLGSWGPCP